MCYYITLAVPEKHAAEVVAAFAAEWQIERSGNPSVAAGLPTGLVPLLLGAGGCCGALYTRSAGRMRAARLRGQRRYKRLGWSQSKIQRALAGSDEPLAGDGLHPQVVKLLQEVVARTGVAAVVVHWYSGIYTASAGA